MRGGPAGGAPLHPGPLGHPDDPGTPAGTTTGDGHDDTAGPLTDPDDPDPFGLPDPFGVPDTDGTADPDGTRDAPCGEPDGGPHGCPVGGSGQGELTRGKIPRGPVSARLRST
jgi:hypothetical protein